MPSKNKPICPNCGCQGCGNVFIESDNVYICNKCGTEYSVADEGSIPIRKTTIKES